VDFVEQLLMPVRQRDSVPLLFALPDDPAAMISTFYALVREALMRMSGMRPCRLPGRARPFHPHLAQAARPHRIQERRSAPRGQQLGGVDATSPHGGARWAA